MIYTYLSFLTIFLAWEFVTHQNLISPFFLPTPEVVFTALIDLFYNHNLLGDIAASLYRILFGFLISIIVAIPLGILIGINKKIEAFTLPSINFIRYLPPSALVPLFILWFGIGDIEKIVIIFSGIAPYLTILVLDTVLHTKQEYIDTALTLGATHWDIVTKVIIPSSLPAIWDALRLMAGVAWLFVVLAEIVAANSGLGHLIISSQRFLQTPQVIGVIIVIGIFGLLTDFSFKFFYRILFPWSEKNFYVSH